jgi:hypothetical protein
MWTTFVKCGQEGQTMIGDDESDFHGELVEPFCPNFKPEQFRDMGIKRNEDFMKGHIKETNDTEFDPNSPYWWLRSKEAYEQWGKGSALDDVKKELGDKLVTIEKLKEVQEKKKKVYKDMEKRKAYKAEWMKKKREEKKALNAQGVDKSR